MKRPAKITVVCTICHLKRYVSSFDMTRKELEEECKDYICTDHLPKRASHGA